MLLYQWPKKRLELRYGLLFLTFLPYFFSFYLYLRPTPPPEPYFQFYSNLSSLRQALMDYLGQEGVALPFAVWAVIVSREARFWIFSFSALVVFMSIFGKSGINPLAYFSFLGGFSVSLLGGIGLAFLPKRLGWARPLLYSLVFVVIGLPFYYQIGWRLSVQWTGAIDPDQVQAGTFIRHHTPEDATFLMLPNSRYSAVTLEGLGERKVVFGWFFHLSRYENQDRLLERFREIHAFFLHPEPAKQLDFIQKYKMDYIFLGPDEKEHMRKNHVDVEAFASGFPTVYRTPAIQILKTNRPGLPGSPFVQPLAGGVIRQGCPQIAYKGRGPVQKGIRGHAQK